MATAIKRRNRIPHCRLLRVADIKPGMMVSAVPVERGLSGESPRKFYDVVRVWPDADEGFIWIRRVMGYRKTKESLHASTDRLLVQLRIRAKRAKQVA